VARLLSYIKDEKARISKNIKPRKLDQDLSAASNGSLRNPNFGSTRAKGAIVDIVVPVYNALTDVQDCLQSILLNESMLPARVIIVDDGSDTDTKAWLENWVREPRDGSIKFELIQHTDNLGYTKAVNAGLRASNASFIVTLNSDTIVAKNWLEGMIRCMLSSNDIGICGPLSNAASWQNVPELLNDEGSFAINDLPSGFDVQTMASVPSPTFATDFP
jgi:cellulose synthase/poly-beta-1,6-N-acetylglucosamine synthase-like glycosyltransferase